MNLNAFFNQINIKSGQNIIIHCSLKNLKSLFPDITPEIFFKTIMDVVTKKGSIILPTFTYCFKKKDGSNQIFDKNSSPSKVGIFPEAFRNYEGVVRTSSPTHSFGIWGRVKKEISKENSPKSPLGAESVMEWMANTEESYVLLIGTDFSVLSFGHYLEVIAQVPWANISPWNYMGIEKIGVSIQSEQPLIEIPGCAKSFVNFQNYLLRKKLITPIQFKDLIVYFINIELLLEHGLQFFTYNLTELLCPDNTCKACDSRKEAIRLNQELNV